MPPIINLGTSLDILVVIEVGNEAAYLTFCDDIVANILLIKKLVVILWLSVLHWPVGTDCDQKLFLNHVILVSVAIAKTVSLKITPVIEIVRSSLMSSGIKFLSSNLGISIGSEHFVQPRST